MSSPARIIFAGSPEFAVPQLEVLLRSDHEVVAVLTQPDRPSGRGRKLQAGPVKQAAQAANIPVLQPESLRTADVQKQLAALQPDLLVVVAYGLLLPAAVLDMPKLGCINLHASILPRWRGASPIQTAILAGDETTGVCIMQMDAGLDTGAVLASGEIAISPHENSGELHDRLAALGANLLRENLPAIVAAKLPATPQSDEGVSYAPRISKADGLIDWRQAASTIAQQVRAYNPWPVAHTLFNGESLRCWAASIDADGLESDALPGTLLGKHTQCLRVQTGDGVLLLERVQLAGRKQVSAGDFANAHPIDAVVLGQ
jgi:methionyl-tRNA formyltransferase